MNVLCTLPGQCERGLDRGVLLLPFGCVSDDKRDEAEDEDSDVSCGHRAGLLLKKLGTK